MIEVWKQIKGYSLYEVSNLGQIRCIGGKTKTFKSKWGTETTMVIKPRIMAQTIRSKSHMYYCVGMTNDKGKRVTEETHRLVAMAFHKRPKGATQVNHKDGNKLNNHAPNLEWTTPKKNTHHAIRTGLKRLKMDQLQVDVIRSCRKSGVSFKDLCRYFKISNPYARGICDNRSRKINYSAK
jgi:hypothetical protein